MPGLGSTLQQLRVAQTMTQRQLARKAKVTPGYVAQLEGGLRKNPSLAVLRRFARALGVDLTVLLR
jgi:XRE family transcriptional regulator, master regulator for biofilm formation